MIPIYLVGAKTQANPTLLLAAISVFMRACNIGNTNAAVFPLPVCANPIISFPANACGIACACISVGAVYLRSIHACESSGIRPRDSNVGASSIVISLC